MLCEAGHAVGGVVVEISAPPVLSEQVPDRPARGDDLAAPLVPGVLRRQGDAPVGEGSPEAPLDAPHPVHYLCRLQA